MANRDPQQRPNQQQFAEQTWTEEEKRILISCRRDSFYQRAMPMGTVFGIASVVAGKFGYIKPTFWKTFGAIITGYVVGNVSHIPVCKERILREIPNSNLAKAIRKENYPKSAYSIGGQNLPIETEQEQTSHGAQDTYTNNNIDTYRPTYDLDSQRPDQYANREEQSQPVKKTMTYDEIRLMNRNKDMRPSQPPPQSTDPLRTNNSDRTFPRRDDTFIDNRQRDISGSNQQPEEEAPRFQRRRPFSEDSGKSGTKNVYGDVWDK